MSRLAIATFLVVLVASAGCVAPSFDGVSAAAGPDDPADTAADGAADVGGATPVAAASTTSGLDGPNATSAPAPSRPNPWGSEPIVVAVEDRGSEARDYVPIVRNATRYWESRARHYAGFSVDYAVRPDAADPDLVVTFVDEVPSCGDATHAAGCAPVVRRTGQIDRPERVSIRTGLSESSTTHVVTHELGHTLGLGHDDAPNDVMRAKSVLYTRSRTNATDRAFPWSDPEFSVFVDAENASDPDGVRAQARHALSYYERGADGTTPANLSIAFVDSPDGADVTVGFSSTSPCGKGSGSCFTTVGPDPDGDGAIERYSRLRIVLVDLDTAATGWHVGNWFAYGLGMETADQRPAPFRDAGYRERRGEWWADDD